MRRLLREQQLRHENGLLNSTWLHNNKDNPAVQKGDPARQGANNSGKVILQR